MEKIQVFLDTDVIVSVLLSETGASHELMKSGRISRVISEAIREEAEIVTNRLGIDRQKTEKLLEKIEIVSLGLSKKDVLEGYAKFVLDVNDSHVVAGAFLSKSRFLLTHNLKHYRVDKIGAGLGVLVLKPGNFLQYLRSLEK